MVSRSPHAALAAALLLAAPAMAQDNALLDLLVRKKVISATEADAVAVDLQKEKAEQSANKLKLGSAITELRISGDLRGRYQYDNRDLQVDPLGVGGDEDRSPSGAQRSRWRFRLRLNGDFKLGENIFGGVQLVTGQAADSDMQTFENGFADYDIFISRAFLGWEATKWLTLVGGKVPNPFYTTEMVWDADINPTGVTAAVKFHELFGGAQEDAGLSKDGKTMFTKTAQLPWELTLNLGAFLYDDNFEDSLDNDSADDAYLGVAQLVGSYKLTPDVKITFAPGVMFFNAADLSGFINENSFSDVAGISGEARKQLIITAPGDISFKLAGLKTKLYWDAAYNTQGQGRFDDIYGLFVPQGAPGGFRSLHTTQDDFAWLAGVQFGELKKAGDVQMNVNFRETGISSVDPNLNESDFALSELNTRGVKAQLFYNLTDFMNAGVSYMYAWNLRDNLFGGQATGGAAVADGNVIQVLQVDLNVKF